MQPFPRQNGNRNGGKMERVERVEAVSHLFSQIHDSTLQFTDQTTV